MDKKIILIVVMGFLGAFVIFIKISPRPQLIVNQNLKSENIIAVSPTIIPTPTTIILNSDSDLEAETDLLTPENFSEDLQNLKDTINNF